MKQLEVVIIVRGDSVEEDAILIEHFLTEITGELQDILDEGNKDTIPPKQTQVWVDDLYIIDLENAKDEENSRQQVEIGFAKAYGLKFKKEDEQQEH